MIALARPATTTVSVVLVALHTAYGAFVLVETPPVARSTMVLAAMLAMAFAFVETITTDARPLFGWVCLATWAVIVATAWGTFVSRVP